MNTGTVVVTGAAWFVGWHVCGVMLDAGWTVVGVDNFDTYYPREIKEAGLALLEGRPAFRFHELDVRDPQSMRAVLESANAVVHLAERPGVRQSVGAEEVYRAINEHGTACLLDACGLAGVRRIVFASTRRASPGSDGSRRGRSRRPLNARLRRTARAEGPAVRSLERAPTG